MNTAYLEYNFAINPIIHFNNGEFVRLDSYDDLAEELALVCHDYKISTLKTNSHAIAELENSINLNLSKYYNVYDKVIVEVI